MKSCLLLFPVLFCVACRSSPVAPTASAEPTSVTVEAPAALVPSSLLPGRYKVNVSRSSTDRYTDWRSGVVIQTRFCFQFVFYQDAVLTWKGVLPIGSTLTFTTPKASCQVVALR